jgi:hypothetical protein
VEVIREKVAKSLLSSYTIKEFEKNLQKQGFEFYVGGNTAGVSLFSKPCACLSFVCGVGCFWFVL